MTRCSCLFNIKPPWCWQKQMPDTFRRAKTKHCTVVGNITSVKKAAARNVFNIKFRRKTAHRSIISSVWSFHNIMKPVFTVSDAVTLKGLITGNHSLHTGSLQILHSNECYSTFKINYQSRNYFLHKIYSCVWLIC